jgi:uroporphyrinogen-III decarboxylase
MGDVDLKAAKAQFGRDMCVKGNLNSIGLMYQGTPAMVREATRQKLELGMPGGRYYCAVGDQIPYQTPPENVEALVESVMQFGRY